MHSFLIASNIAVIRTGLQSILQDVFKQSEFTEVKSKYDASSRLAEGKYGFLIVDFSYLHKVQDDLNWAHALKTIHPTLSILLFVDDHSFLSKDVLDPSLKLLGRGSTINNIVDGLNSLVSAANSIRA